MFGKLPKKGRLGNRCFRLIGRPKQSQRKKASWWYPSDLPKLRRMKTASWTCCVLEGVLLVVLEQVGRRSLVGSCLPMQDQ